MYTCSTAVKPRPTQAEQDTYAGVICGGGIRALLAISSQRSLWPPVPVQVRGVQTVHWGPSCIAAQAG